MSNPLLKELLDAYSELLDEAMAIREQSYGNFRGGPAAYYADEIALRDRVTAALADPEAFTQSP